MTPTQEGYTDMDEHNEARRARVRFGTKPTQTIPHEYAERLLMKFAADSPAAFGKRLSAVVIADLEEGKPNGQQP